MKNTYRQLWTRNACNQSNLHSACVFTVAGFTESGLLKQSTIVMQPVRLGGITSVLNCIKL